MTAGIPGAGPYSKLKDLRFQARRLKGELANKPMGPRTRKRKERELTALRSELRKINQEIRTRKQFQTELETEGRYFDKMSHLDSGVHRLLQAYGGPDILAVAESAAQADVAAGFDPMRLIPSRHEVEAELQRHIAAMTPARRK